MLARLSFLAAMLAAALPTPAAAEPVCAAVPRADTGGMMGDLGASIGFGGAGGCMDPPCFHLGEDGAKLNLQAWGGREFVVQPSGVLTGCLRLPEP